MISRQTLGYFRTLDLTQTFELTFDQLPQSTATLLVF